MLLHRISAILAATILASCADIDPAKPPLVGNVSAVSSADIRLATLAAQQRLAADGHSNMPIFRVDVFGPSKIEVFAGEHYGPRPGYPVIGTVVERVKGRWQVTRSDQLEHEDAIITG